MSTPSPGRISLPAAKPYRVTIDSENYPNGFPAQLVFSEDVAAQSWNANFSVANIELTELNCPVTQQDDGEYQFEFRIDNPTPEQRNAGYIKGTYIFQFPPPGTAPRSFGGTVNDPWKKPDQAEDNWTAEGQGPEE